MKKLQLISAIFCLSILLASCAREYHPELVGHYKPNTDVAKKSSSQPASHSEKIIQSLPAQNENEGVASVTETQPDLRLVQSPLQQASSVKMTPKQEQKFDKKLEKLKEKVEKHTAQSGKQIQHNDLSSNKTQLHPSSDDKLLYVIIAILIPWLGVALYENDITNHFWICLLLWFLFYIPGLIYALYIILSK